MTLCSGELLQAETLGVAAWLSLHLGNPLSSRSFPCSSLLDSHAGEERAIAHERLMLA
jgi:hypothetical protein